MDWTMLGAVATAMGVLVTAAYTFLFLWAIRYAARQVKEMAKAREIQVLLDIFRELKTEKFMDERGYIYEKFPESVEGVDSLQLKAHLQEAEETLAALHRVGYLAERGYIDTKPIMENYWPLLWRCWKKSKNLIIWAREQRNEPDYLSGLEYLGNLAQAYCVGKGYSEPKFF